MLINEWRKQKTHHFEGHHPSSVPYCLLKAPYKEPNKETKEPTTTDTPPRQPAKDNPQPNTNVVMKHAITSPRGVARIIAYEDSNSMNTKNVFGDKNTTCIEVIKHSFVQERTNLG